MVLVCQLQFPPQFDIKATKDSSRVRPVDLFLVTIHVTRSLWLITLLRISIHVRYGPTQKKYVRTFPLGNFVFKCIIITVWTSLGHTQFAQETFSQIRRIVPNLDYYVALPLGHVSLLLYYHFWLYLAPFLQLFLTTRLMQLSILPESFDIPKLKRSAHLHVRSPCPMLMWHGILFIVHWI